MKAGHVPVTPISGLVDPADCAPYDGRDIRISKAPTRSWHISRPVDPATDKKVKANLAERVRCWTFELQDMSKPESDPIRFFEPREPRHDAYPALPGALTEAICPTKDEAMRVAEAARTILQCIQVPIDTLNDTKSRAFLPIHTIEALALEAMRPDFHHTELDPEWRADVSTLTRKLGYTIQVFESSIKSHHNLPYANFNVATADGVLHPCRINLADLDPEKIEALGDGAPSSFHWKVARYRKKPAFVPKKQTQTQFMDPETVPEEQRDLGLIMMRHLQHAFWGKLVIGNPNEIVREITEG